jgi:hypothetical protein
MSLNALCSNNETNKFLPEVYLLDLKTDSLVLKNSVPSYSGSNLNYFEEVMLTPTWSNAPNPIVLGTGKVKVSRVGTTVSLCFDNFVGTVTANPITSNAILPVRFRPAQQIVDVPIIIQVGSTEAVGVMEIKTDGTFQVYPTVNTGSANWSSSVDSGWIKFGCSYTVDSF